MLFVDDWRCDQHKWEHFGRKLLKTQPVICKTYFKYSPASVDAKTDFKRYAYTIPGSVSNFTLVHYKGDDAIANEMAPHIRTCGSLLK